MSDTATQIAELEEKLENLRRQKLIEDEAARSLTPEQKLAIVMHNTMCPHNHADGCGWYYEVKNGIHDWRQPTHGLWLDRAGRFAHFCTNRSVSFETAEALVAHLHNI